MTKICAILTVLLLTLGAVPGKAQTERRVALVIGNGGYQHLPRLDNPARDAQLIAATLQSTGFQLVGGRAQTDLDRPAFERALRQFGAELAGGAVGLFYYAGHGVALQGTNYLVPVGANPTTAADADLELVNADIVLRQMEAAGSRLNILLLDACRNNPFGGRGLRDAGQGLATMRAPRGTIISYATQPGNVALDGSGGHSPYSAALADALRRPGLPVLEVFNQVGLTVDRATGGRQQPWVSSSPLEGTFYFLGPTTVSTVNTVNISPDSDTVFWQSIAQSNNPADFDEYLRQFPQGRYSGLARNRSAALRVATAPARAPTHPARGFDGSWTGTYTCGSTNRGDPGFTNRISGIVRDGNATFSSGSGSKHLSGSIQDGGAVTLQGEGIGNRPELRSYGRTYNIILMGQFQGEELSAQGVQLGRSCILALRRLSRE